MFSDKKVIDLLKDNNVVLVKVDMTNNEEVFQSDLIRSKRQSIPVNIIYPADYPKSKAILLEEFISPQDAIDALEKVIK